MIGHGDVGPWNIVARDGIAIALVAWEFAGPVDRLDEVAEAIRLNCQLHGKDVSALHRLSHAQARARQVRLFLGPHPMVWGMVWQARGARWILNNAGVLHSSLGRSYWLTIGRDVAQRAHGRLVGCQSLPGGRG